MSNLIKTVERDENGLVKGIDYIFRDDGTIDWRKMVKPEYLAINVKNVKETDVSKVNDEDLIILLAGLKDLAKLRGFTSVKFQIATASSQYVAAKCSIEWRPNYETEQIPVTYEAIADANDENTFGFASQYLAAIAENRALARCIRGFLNINIVAKEELKELPQVKDNPTDPVTLLKTLMNSKNITFEKLKAKMVKDGVNGVNEIENIYQIPVPKVLELIQIIRTAKPRNKKPKLTPVE
jgi:hypothetical protein